MFTICEAWLIEHQSKAGAWTADQLAAIGVAWPPAHGWKRNAVGRIITDTQKARFERALKARAARADATLDLFG